MDLLHGCANCGKRNRLSVSQLNKAARCGFCKAELGPINQPIEVDPALFESVVKESPLPVLVDFWASWCGPCRMAAPEVARTAVEMAGRAIVLKVDTELYPGLAERYNVRGIPNFAVFSHGRLRFQQAEVVPHQALEEWLTKAA